MPFTTTSTGPNGSSTRPSITTATVGPSPWARTTSSILTRRRLPKAATSTAYSRIRAARRSAPKAPLSTARSVTAGNRTRGGGAQPLHRPQARAASAREARGQQVATGRRFPVQHLAGAEHAGQGIEHQSSVHRLQPHAAGAADYFLDRPCTLEHQR